jgi:alkylation response protein AidB-like acyl-CoA dehydrogenase
MDFTWSENQTMVQELGEELFSTQLSDADFEQHFSEKCWRELARTELLALATAAEFGGSDMGLVELLLLLRQAARHAAPIPLLESIVLAAPLLQAHGSTEQKTRWLRQLASGEKIISLALHEPGGGGLCAPRCAAQKTAEGYAISGSKTAVSFSDKASAYIVSAQLDKAPALFLVQAADVSGQRQTATNDQGLEELCFTEAPAELISADNVVVLGFERRFHLAISAQILGLSETALKLTAGYTAERQQFGVAIGSFQAVRQRLADAFITVQTMSVSLWRAAWLETTDADSRTAVMQARFLASEGGHQVGSAAQHLHAGTGFDRDYPLHRYFLGIKQIEFVAGGASAQLQRLGDHIAEEVR